jgi:hypothetical protein
MAPRQQQSMAQSNQPVQPGNVSSNMLVPVQQPMISQPSNIQKMVQRQQQPMSQNSIPPQPGNNMMVPMQQMMPAMAARQGQADIQQQQYPLSQHLVIANQNVTQPYSTPTVAPANQQPPMVNSGDPNTMHMRRPQTQQLMPGANQLQQAPKQLAPAPKDTQVVPVNGLICPQPPTMDDIRNSMSATSQSSNKFGFY